MIDALGINAVVFVREFAVTGIGNCKLNISMCSHLLRSIQPGQCQPSVTRYIENHAVFLSMLSVNTGHEHRPCSYL